jgi:hypothetical protein
MGRQSSFPAGKNFLARLQAAFLGAFLLLNIFKKTNRACAVKSFRTSPIHQSKRPVQRVKNQGCVA